MSDLILDDLTPPQREAVMHMNGPMLVVAGAGSGKTRVVTRRIAYLIREGVRPHQILAMTFTNKAAGEMKERVAEMVGRAPAWVGTFHSMCARLLRYDLEKLNEGRSGRFSIYDDDDQIRLIRQILKDQKLDDKRFRPRTLQSAISRSKCDMIGPEEFGVGSWQDQKIAEVYREYETRLRNTDAVDFDDLLVLMVRLLERVPAVRAAYQERFPYLLIDEYQDTNHTQYRLMRMLCGTGQNVHATGDPDQSIYSWRGAEYRNIMDFQKDFPEARLVRLEQNYRSTKCILQAANHLIRNNGDRIDKDLFTENPDGTRIVSAALGDDRSEAQWILGRVESLQAEGMPLQKMAVFYRTNAQSRAIEEALIDRGIPYQLIGGVRFYQRKEIKDFLAHLKLLVNPRDLISLQRVIGCRPTGVGPKTLAKIIAAADAREMPPFTLLSSAEFASFYAAKPPAKLKAFSTWCHRLANVPQTPLPSAVREWLQLSGLLEHLELGGEEERVENLSAFLERVDTFAMENPDATLPAFLEDVALVADIDSFDAERDQLSLMTLHAAKGLEFPVVFIGGLEEGLLPHENSRTNAQREEERRLFYVGITRAREKLFLTHATSRMINGQIGVAPSSEFLDELPDELLEVEDLADPLGWGVASTGRFQPSASGRGQSRRKQKQVRFGDFDDTFDLDGMDVFGEFDGLDDPFPDEFENAPVRGKPRGSSATLRSGDLVMHGTFGKGKVLAVSGRNIMVHFFVGGTKTLQQDMANLRRL